MFVREKLRSLSGLSARPAQNRDIQSNRHEVTAFFVVSVTYLFQFYLLRTSSSERKFSGVGPSKERSYPGALGIAWPLEIYSYSLLGRSSFSGDFHWDILFQGQQDY